MNYTIIDLDKVHEVVNKEEGSFICRVEPFNDLKNMKNDIEKWNIPHDVTTSDGLVKETMKQKMHELIVKYRLWVQK